MDNLLLVTVVFLSVLLGITLGAVVLRGCLALVSRMLPARRPLAPTLEGERHA